MISTTLISGTAQPDEFQEMVHYLMRRADDCILEALLKAPSCGRIERLTEAAVAELLKEKRWPDDGETYGVCGPDHGFGEPEASNGNSRKFGGVWWSRHPMVPGAGTERSATLLWPTDTRLIPLKTLGLMRGPAVTSSLARHVRCWP